MTKDMSQMAIASMHRLEAHLGTDQEPNPDKHRNMLEDVRLAGGLSEQMFVWLDEIGEHQRTLNAK